MFFPWCSTVGLYAESIAQVLERFVLPLWKPVSEDICCRCPPGSIVDITFKTTLRLRNQAPFNT